MAPAGEDQQEAFQFPAHGWQGFAAIDRAATSQKYRAAGKNYTRPAVITAGWPGTESRYQERAWEQDLLLKHCRFPTHAKEKCHGT